MDWSEFWGGAVKFLEEASKFVAAVGVVIVAILQVWNRRTSIANSTEIKGKLDKQDVVLETFRVDAVETAAKAVEVKRATEDVKQAAEEVKHGAAVVAEAAKQVVEATSPTSGEVRLTKP